MRSCLPPSIISPAMSTSGLPELLVSASRFTSALSPICRRLTVRERPSAPISVILTLPERKPSSSVINSTLAADSSESTGNTVRFLNVTEVPSRQSCRAGAPRFEATARAFCPLEPPSALASAIFPVNEQASETTHRQMPASTVIGAFIRNSLLLDLRLGWRFDLALERGKQCHLATRARIIRRRRAKIVPRNDD